VNNQKNKTAEDIVRELEKGIIEPLSKEDFDRFETMTEDEEMKLKGDDFELLKKYYAQKRINRKQRVKDQEREMQPFYNELNKNGVNTNYSEDIEDKHLNETTIGIILKHLHLDYSKKIKRILIQALDSKKAQGIAGEELISLYKNWNSLFSH